MADKRRLLVKPTEEELDQEDDDPLVPAKLSDRDIAIEGTWNDWFFHVFLKYTFLVFMLFLACVLPLEAVRSLEGDLGLAVAFLSILSIVPVAILAFFRLWGDGGRWSDPSEDL